MDHFGSVPDNDVVVVVGGLARLASLASGEASTTDPSNHAFPESR
jgi:hypothetical protein